MIIPRIVFYIMKGWNESGQLLRYLKDMKKRQAFSKGDNLSFLYFKRHLENSSGKDKFNYLNHEDLGHVH